MGSPVALPLKTFEIYGKKGLFIRFLKARIVNNISNADLSLRSNKSYMNFILNFAGFRRLITLI